MIKFNSLSLRNFQTYGDVPTVINFDCQGTVLIIGENGAGKSCWPFALTYCLYDEAISKVSKDDLINNINKKNMEVIVDFEKNRHHYIVRRARKFKITTGNFVQLFEDEKEITLDSVARTNAKIQEIIGIPYELFIRIVTFPATLIPFLELPARGSGANQTEIIEELFDLKVLSQKAETLKEVIRDTDTKFQLEEQKLEHVRAEQERYKTQLSTLTQHCSGWETENKAKIQHLELHLAKIKQINVKKEKKIYEEIEQVKKNLNNIKDKIARLELQQKNIEQLKKTQMQRVAQIEACEQRAFDWAIMNKTCKEQAEADLINLNKVDIEQQKTLYEQRVALRKGLDETKKELDQEEANLNAISSTTAEKEREAEQLKSSKCPYCLQSFPGSKQKLHEVSLEIKHLNTEAKSINKSILELNSKVDNELTTINGSLFDVLTHSIDELYELSEQKNTLTQDLKRLAETKNPFIEPLAELEQDVSNVSINELDEECSEVQKQISDHINKLAIEAKNQSKLEKEITITSFDELLELSEKQALVNGQLKTAKQAENPFYTSLEELERMKPAQPTPDIMNGLKLELEDQRVLYKLLTKKDSFIRKGLLDRNLTYLNKRLQLYLHEMGFTFTVEFTHDMSARISIQGRELGFGNLSGGQKARVNLALSFAFRDVLQSLHDKTNICILDEALDYGLDTTGVSLAAKMLKKKAKDEGVSLYVISHREEVDTIFDKTITISLVDGFSTIQLT